MSNCANRSMNFNLTKKKQRLAATLATRNVSQTDAVSCPNYKPFQVNEKLTFSVIGKKVKKVQQSRFLGPDFQKNLRKNPKFSVSFS